MSNHCPAIDCDWSNSFATSQDGSREAALGAHFNGVHGITHPRGTCHACDTPTEAHISKYYVQPPSREHPIISGNPTHLFDYLCPAHKMNLKVTTPRNTP